MALKYTQYNTLVNKFEDLIKFFSRPRDGESKQQFFDHLSFVGRFLNIKDLTVVKVDYQFKCLSVRKASRIKLTLKTLTREKVK
jgi:hypothetical protein